MFLRDIYIYLAINHTYLNKHKQFTRTVVITVFLMTGQRFIGGKAFHIMVYSSFLYLVGNKSQREIRKNFT